MYTFLYLLMLFETIEVTLQLEHVNSITQLFEINMQVLKNVSIKMYELKVAGRYSYLSKPKYVFHITHISNDKY